MKDLWYAISELAILKVSVVLVLAGILLFLGVAMAVWGTMVGSGTFGCVLAANVLLLLGGVAQLARWHKKAHN